MAVLFTKAFERVLAPGLSALDNVLPENIATRNPLAITWREFEKTLDHFLETALLGAKT